MAIFFIKVTIKFINLKFFKIFPENFKKVVDKTFQLTYNSRVIPQ